MFRASVLPLALVVAVFAGCVGSEAGGGQSAPTDPTLGRQAQFDETTGGIEGVVTDAELVPVAGATVGIVGEDPNDTTLMTLTDESGSFALSHVPRGDHVLVAQAEGYEAGGTAIEVHLGQVTSVAIILGQMPANVPYHRVFTTKVTLSGILYKATPSCIYTSIDPLVKTCGGVRFNQIVIPPPVNYTIPLFKGCPSCETHTAEKMSDFTGAWETIVAEMMWKPQTGVTGRGFSFDLNAPNITRGTGGSINQADAKTWQKQTAKPPIVIRVDKNITLPERNIAEVDWNNYGNREACSAPAPRGSDGKKTVANCDWFFRVFPASCDLGICPDGTGPDYGIMYEGTGEVFFSYFIHEVAPDGYTGLPDA